MWNWTMHMKPYEHLDILHFQLLFASFCRILEATKVHSEAGLKAMMDAGGAAPGVLSC